MENTCKVRLTEDLSKVINSWSEADQEQMKGFMNALCFHGLDVVFGNSEMVRCYQGLSLEYSEPGETPEMVWCMVFIDLPKGDCHRIRIQRMGDKIILDGS